MILGMVEAMFLILQPMFRFNIVEHRQSGGPELPWRLVYVLTSTY